MAKFESNNFSMKLGDILKTFTNSNYAMSESAEVSMSQAVPIWEVLGMTEEAYYIKYAVTNISESDKTEEPVKLKIEEEVISAEIVDEDLYPSGKEE